MQDILDVMKRNAQRESKLEDRCIKYAKARGWLVRKVRWLDTRSAPDRIFAKAGRGVFFVEFKKPGEKPTLLQAQEHAEMRIAGMQVLVIDNFEAFCAVADS